MVTYTKLAELARPTHVLPAKIDSKKVQPMSLMARMRAKNSTRKTEKPAKLPATKMEEVFAPETEDDENKADSDLEVERPEVEEQVAKDEGKEAAVEEAETKNAPDVVEPTEQVPRKIETSAGENLQEENLEARRNLMCPAKRDDFQREGEDAPAKKKRKRRHKVRTFLVFSFFILNYFLGCKFSICSDTGLKLVTSLFCCHKSNFL